MDRNKKYIFSILFLSAALFAHILDLFFSNDDFYHFTLSQTNNSILEFIKLFGIYPYELRQAAFYRPIFREALYNIYYQLFGLNHFYFRVLSLSMHLVNTFMVYKVFTKIFKGNKVPLLSMFIFAIASANTGSLYYLAGGIQVQGALLFSLLSIYFFEKKYLYSVAFYLLALSSHELGYLVPFVIFSKEFLINKKLPFKKMIPFAILLLAYLYINIFQIGFSKTEVQYQIALNPKKILNSYFWYSLWSLNVPEMFLDYVGPGINININLFKYWSSYAVPIITLAASMLLTITVSVSNIKTQVKNIKTNTVLLIWFVLGLLPVAILPSHRSTYYLLISLPAASALLANIILGSKRKAVHYIFIAVFTLSSLFTIALTFKTHPAANRARVAQKILAEIKNKYPALPSDSTLYIRNDKNYPFISKEWGGTSTQTSYALSKEDAIHLLYDDRTIKVIYEDDLPPIPKENLFEFTAVLD